MAKFSYQTVWQLAGPNIISNVLMTSISFAHLWIIAPYGPDASAAVVTGGRVHFLLMAATMALSVATTAMVARAWGADDAEEASAATTSSLTLAVLISLSLGSVVYAFAPHIAGLFHLDETAAKLAVDYIRPASLLNIVFALMLTIATAFRAIGDVVRPLRFTAAGTTVAIAGSYILVHGTFGLPALGVKGIPWGTAFGQGLVVIWFAVRWLRRHYILTPKPKAAFERARIKQLIDIGAPAAIEQAFIQASFLAFMILLAGYGTASFAAYGIGIAILSVCITAGLGFGVASATLAGQRLGAGDPKAAMASGWAAMRLAIMGMTVLAVITVLLRVPLAELLSTDAEVRHYTEYFILILALVQPMMAVEFAIGGALRGSGDTRYPLLVTFTGMILGRLSVGAMVVHYGGPVEAMYAVIIVDYMIKSTMLILRFRSGRWIEAGRGRAPLPLQSIAGLSRESVRRFFFKRSHDHKDDGGLSR
ncbi:MATE family efflux transporter [Kordiimonas marina]|uniref:MATE family efflux transporter n=1 Tax=Kordiimonas marina TaxID=2872312 RepID=UPI001FF56F63|nr:MATE family efflux transporter [Kordiimonas marina]MCJ9429091.1 MATE family efflux transporter [Kordiimonas marina]